MEIWTAPEENMLVMKDDITRWRFRNGTRRLRNCWKARNLLYIMRMDGSHVLDVTERRRIFNDASPDRDIPAGRKEGSKGYLTAEPLVFEVLE